MHITEILNLYNLSSKPDQLKHHAEAEEIPDIVWAKGDHLSWREHKKFLKKYERVWLKDPMFSLKYALAAEKKIPQAESAFVALYDNKKIEWDDLYNYWRGPRKYGRWPEAEHIIMTVPYWAMIYARDVLKRRWPECEPYLLKPFGDASLEYGQIFGPFPGFEAALLHKAGQYKNWADILPHYVTGKLKIPLQAKNKNSPLAMFQAYEILKNRVEAEKANTTPVKKTVNKKQR